MDAVIESVDQSQYLSFFIAGEEYAIKILRVREIIEYDTLTKVPGMPATVRGVINLRGNVVPVVDLAVRFGLPESEITPRSCVVIVEIAIEGEQTAMGVLADSVSQVLELLPGEIEDPPAFGTRVRVDHLLGMGKNGKKFVMILDIDKALSAEELLLINSIDDKPVESLDVDGEESPAESESEQAGPDIYDSPEP